MQEIVPLAVANQPVVVLLLFLNAGTDTLIITPTQQNITTQEAIRTIIPQVHRLMVVLLLALLLVGLLGC